MIIYSIADTTRNLINRKTGLIDRDFVFLDIESTGGSVGEDRITEIGLVTVDRGEITREWSSLINPQRPIPPFIVKYIGIDDAMVADAPRFADIAQELQEMLAGRILVAHNARFDYSFLRHEFGLAGFHYHADVLCSVKLSRRLYPQYQKHNLDTLIARHRLNCEARHRAFGDARVLWDFLQLTVDEKGEAAVNEQITKLIQRPPQPPGLAIDAFDDLPETAGVYLFSDADGQVMLIGKGKNLRAKIVAQLTPGSGNSRSREIQERISRLDWIDTVGIIGAELEEIRLVAEHQPEFNSNLTTADTETIHLVDHESGSCSVEFLPAERISAGGDCYGLYRSRDDALAAIQAAVDKQPVCTGDLGVAGLRCPVHAESGCDGEEQGALLATRIRFAFARLKLPEWPFKNPVVLREEQSWPQKFRVHLFDRWCYLGYAESEVELTELLTSDATGAFDLTVYRLLKRLLEQPKTGLVFKEVGAPNR
jgi:DNA polymerase-3 subunit epsilon